MHRKRSTLIVDKTYILKLCMNVINHNFSGYFDLKSYSISSSSRFKEIFIEKLVQHSKQDWRDKLHQLDFNKPDCDIFKDKSKREKLSEDIFVFRQIDGNIAELGTRPLLIFKNKHVDINILLKFIRESLIKHRKVEYANKIHFMIEDKDAETEMQVENLIYKIPNIVQYGHTLILKGYN